MSKLFEKVNEIFESEVDVISITDIQSEIYEMLSLGKNDGQSKEDNVQATYEEIFNTYSTEELANETFNDEAELRDYIETKANEIYESEEETEDKVLNEVGDTKDYTAQIEKLFRKWFRDNAELGIRIIQWATNSYDLNIKMREVGEGETRKYQYRVSNWSPLVEVEDWADEIGEYIADHIPALEYKGSKVLDRAEDNGEDYEQTIWYFDQQIGIKDFGDHIFDSEELVETELNDQEDAVMVSLAVALSNEMDEPVYWIEKHNQFEFENSREYLDVKDFCEKYEPQVESALYNLSDDEKAAAITIIGKFGFTLEESDKTVLDEDAENILSDEDEAKINELIGKIKELQSTIKHTIGDDIISINAELEALNGKLKYGVDEIDDSDMYLNTQNVISDLEYLIKESNWAKEDAEEMDESENRLAEEFIPNHAGLHCPKCGNNEYYEVDDGEDANGTIHFHYECNKCGYTESDEYSPEDFEESAELVEEVMQPGDKYVNEVGAVIVITDPTNDGRPQYNIAPSQEDYDAGKFVCMGTDSYESLERILTKNTYKKVDTITESEKDYSDLEAKIADEILYEMSKKTLDSTDILEVHKFLEEFVSQEIIKYMDENGVELMWYIEEDPVTAFKVIVNEL